MNDSITAWRRVFASAAVMLLVFFAGMYAYSRIIQSKTTDAQKEILISAIENAMRTCYAVEGAYPGDIDYLIENYGLRYNESRYHIYFDSFAENVMPDVRVIERGRKQP